jgi:hypothetical protein
MVRFFEKERMIRWNKTYTKKGLKMILVRDKILNGDENYSH